MKLASFPTKIEKANRRRSGFHIPRARNPIAESNASR